MAKGIVYVATSEIDGLIKIGSTQNLKKRMHELETDGYKRQKCDIVFAIEVEDYEDKEDLLHSIFGKSRAGKTEFFAEDIELVKQTMLAFDGKKVFPEEGTQEEMFKEVTEVINVKNGVIPEGTYYLDIKIQGTKDRCTATMVVTEERKLILQKGAVFGPLSEKSAITKGWKKTRESLKMDGNVLLEELECKSPSMAAAIVCGYRTNGWTAWKNSKDEPIDIYRPKKSDED
ncbi:MAG: DUF4357 domain-containing protein [Clostridiaceae bacterium]|nr:DUF4357 domain-containing protein [Clostridiaceae bacterium]